ncbi:MAG: transposase [Planctomycetes bacterium]|nr:transposase [Planctomycetota bacterium]
MAADQVMLDQQLRKTVHDAILETAGHFGWSIHALEVRSNHVHVIITAPEKSPGEVMRSLKAYSSRSLSSMDNRGRVKWWTRQGSKKILFTGKALAAAIQYVENQDTSWMKGF